MSRANTTCWTVIHGAAAGRDEDRHAFADRYVSVVRAYLRVRWGSSPLSQDIEDATQDVFVECFREGGALERVQADRPGGFRAFLYGVVRNVALRRETKRARKREDQAATGFITHSPDHREQHLSRVFDRAWAQAIMREAADRQQGLASESGLEAQRRVELLRMRFHEGLPIRRIAELWNDDPARLHREYALARKEFYRALKDVVAFHHPNGKAIDLECEGLLALLE